MNSSCLLWAYYKPSLLAFSRSRGGVLDEAALLRAVSSRGLRAGLDVFEQEPSAGAGRFSDEALRASLAVYGSHHTGARTEQAAEAVEKAILKVVEAFLEQRLIPGLIA